MKEGPILVRSKWKKLGRSFDLEATVNGVLVPSAPLIGDLRWRNSSAAVRVVDSFKTAFVNLSISFSSMDFS